MESNELSEIKKCYGSYEYFFNTYLNTYLTETDKAFIDSLLEGRFHIIASEEVTNNTLLMHLMILWKILFKSTYSNYAILTPKMKQALIYNERFRSYYNMLPEWMKFTQVSNKRQLQLTNGNILFFGCVSCDSIIGWSYNELYCHGFSFVKKEMAEDFVASYFPVVMSGKTAKLFVESYPYLHTQFDEIWDSETFIKHGSRVYRYPLREGIENAI